MPGVNKEQIEVAKRMTAIEFLQRYRCGQLVPSDSRGEFQLVEHDSFKINGTTSKFHWKSRDIGGKSALDYLVKVEGVDFVEAVLTLCEENPQYIPPSSQEKKKAFVLPPAAANNRRVFAYLIQRGIDRPVIEACVRRGFSTRAPTTTMPCSSGRMKPASPGTPSCGGRTPKAPSPFGQKCPAATNGSASSSRPREDPESWRCMRPAIETPCPPDAGKDGR